MAERKFFSGLPDGMMTRGAKGMNRQQTNFYWPDDTDADQFSPARNRMRSRSASIASLMSQSQASTDTEESRRRKSQQNKSKIEFYDLVDCGTDSESVYSRVDPKTRNRLDTLKSRIEFYDFVDTNSNQAEEDAQSVIERPVKKKVEPSVEHNIPMKIENGHKAAEKPKSSQQQTQNNEITQNLARSVQNLSLSPEPKNGYSQHAELARKKADSQYVDSFSESDEEDRYYRSRNQMPERKYVPPQPNRYPPSQRSVRSNPRRHNSEYFDFDDDEYDRNYDSNRRLKYRKPENVPRMVRRRNYSPDISDEDFYDNTDGYRRGGTEHHRSRPPVSPDRHRLNGSRYDDSESYYRGRNQRTPTNGYGSERDFQRIPTTPARRYSPQDQDEQIAQPRNGYASEMEPKMPASARPPVKPLSRTDSMNEAKQRQLVNLKSNIFHNDPEYNVMVEQRKPLSVRDFAARQRVGVGLPDI